MGLGQARVTFSDRYWQWYHELSDTFVNAEQLERDDGTPGEDNSHWARLRLILHDAGRDPALSQDEKRWLDNVFGPEPYQRRGQNPNIERQVIVMIISAVTLALLVAYNRVKV